MDKAAAQSSNLAPVIDAALSLIAESGLEKFTYRALASYAGLTLGEVTSRVGKKDNLLQLLVDRSLFMQAIVHDRWRHRLSDIPVQSPSEFAAIFGSYIRECRGLRRSEAMFWCEMVAEKERLEIAAAFIQSYSAAEENFWHENLRRWIVGDIGELAHIVRNYYFGELGFMLTLGDEPDYEIALTLNLDLLAQKLFARHPSKDGRGDGLLHALRRRPGQTDAIMTLQGQRLEVAQAAGRSFMKHGLSGLTHRTTAQELGVSAAAVSHYFRTKTELINAALWAMHMIIRRHVEGSAGGEVTKTSPKNDGKSVTFLFRAIHSLILAGLHKKDIRSILLRERLDRGKSTADWLGRPQDAVLTQVASIISYGTALSEREDIMDNTPRSEVTRHMIRNIFLDLA